MEGKNKAFTLFAAVAAAVALLLSCSADAQGATICGANLPELVERCWEFVKNPGPLTDPDEGCCSTVRKLDIPCVCSSLDSFSGGQLQVLNLDKCVHVAEKCGNPFRRGSQCGPYNIPPLA